MNNFAIGVAALMLAAGLAPAAEPAARVANGEQANQPSFDQRMQWWRDARFGMFIHWGLYAIPAGKWGDRTDHGEWIMNTAHIPVEQYEQFLAQFNPTKFDADAWVKLAKDAGMKYITITSKHHDGFALFDSKVSDYDVMATPFKRDIMKELADAAAKNDVKMCWYHSIMDWHHPDYTPRREWETRSKEGADFDRYVKYMKGQLTELLTNYGPIGVLWFDGQWEGTWNNDRGRDLDTFVRGLQPNIIINSRVGRGGGAYGLESTEHGGRLGDYGTPEQFIPEADPGIDWETCMTMNGHWGYNAADKDFKTTEDLLRKLADIASKSGNFLLNVGPTASGEIPPESVQRLQEIGKWMDVNGESIYGTVGSPFKQLAWGRCTQKQMEGGNTRLYLHVFDWPTSGSLVIPGLLNDTAGARLLATGAALKSRRDGDAVVIAVPPKAPDAINSVIVLDIMGKPDVTNPPVFANDVLVFVDKAEAVAKTDRANVELRYTTDGSEPTATSPVMAGPVTVTTTSTVKARAFRGDKAVSPSASATFTKIEPQAPATTSTLAPGLMYTYYEGTFKSVKDFDGTKANATGQCSGFDINTAKREDRYGFRFDGFVVVPKDGVYQFSTRSDDGSVLLLNGKAVVENDGLHSADEKSGVVALKAGAHAISVLYFEATGGDELVVSWKGPGFEKQAIPASALQRQP